MEMMVYKRRKDLIRMDVIEEKGRRREGLLIIQKDNIK
jgi:hypothetical protein